MFNMTNEDKEFITQILSTHYAEVNGKFDVINVKLESIIKQTTITNGRVNKLENVTIPDINEKISKISLNEINHVVNCPQSSKIKLLEEEQLKNLTIKKFMITTISIVGIFSAVIGVIYEVFIKK